MNLSTFEDKREFLKNCLENIRRINDTNLNPTEKKMEIKESKQDADAQSLFHSIPRHVSLEDPLLNVGIKVQKLQILVDIYNQVAESLFNDFYIKNDEKTYDEELRKQIEINPAYNLEKIQEFTKRHFEYTLKDNPVCKALHLNEVFNSTLQKNPAAMKIMSTHRQDPNSFLSFFTRFFRPKSEKLLNRYGFFDIKTVELENNSGQNNEAAPKISKR